MPGRVTTFLRNPSGNIKLNRSWHTSPESSDAEDMHSYDRRHHHHSHHPRKLSDFTEALKSHRRLSLPFGKKESQPSVASIDCRIESPPVVFHGRPQDSTGAIVSGVMIVDVKEESVEFEDFRASLNIHVTHKRPFQSNCPDCADQYTEIKGWDLLAHPTLLYRGRHAFPFSTLLDGHLPASMHGSLMSIAYELKAEAHIATHSLAAAAAAHPNHYHHHLPSNVIKFERALIVKRALPKNELPHHSIRLFPPTNIKSDVHYDTVIHPTSANKVSLRLDGLTALNEKAQSLDIWRLKKITWKLEETTKTIAPACPRHSPLAQDLPVTEESTEDTEPATKKGVARTEVRLLGEKMLHDGWKSEYSSTDGSVEIEFDYLVNQRLRKGQLKYAADSRSRDGTVITHSLLIELVVSKEFAPINRPQHSAQTGTGRILRMHFPVVLTEHPGLGVSWDEEAPPVYQDVPPSPPSYEPSTPATPVGTMTPVVLPPVDYDDLEFLDARRLSGEPPSRRPSGCHGMDTDEP